jgi:hypothetical protein
MINLTKRQREIVRTTLQREKSGRPLLRKPHNGSELRPFSALVRAGLGIWIVNGKRPDTAFAVREFQLTDKGKESVA